MAGPTENDLASWGMSGLNFRAGGCSWCHPGGGALEYDRDGYRFDSRGTGANPNRAADNGAVNVVKPDGTTLDTNSAGVRSGDYWTFIPGDGGGILTSYAALGDSKGVIEADCLMCHLDMTKGYYNNQARDYCQSTPGAGKSFDSALGATVALNLTGLVSTGDTGVNTGNNPACSAAGIAWNSTSIDGTWINKKPAKENCALCHFADVGNKAAGNGVAGNPLAFATFQKKIGANAFVDTDLTTGGQGTCSATTSAVCWTDGDCPGSETCTGKNNGTIYTIAKGRAEFAKRGSSINDPANPDAHGVLQCADCHYPVSGSFAAVEDGQGRTIAEAVSVKRIDHQFAKGNNRPDGKNMDQLDNTVTCESCHTLQTHPNLVKNGGAIPTPDLTAWATKHSSLPSFHLDKIDCRTCHIPYTNFQKSQVLSDFSTMPYPEAGIERGQSVASTDGGTTRLRLTPIYAWRDRGHDGEVRKGYEGSDLKITPIMLGTSAIWKDLSTGKPYAKRFASKGAKMAAARIGDANTDGIKDLPFNRAQNGDTALVANTRTELAWMVDALNGSGDHPYTQGTSSLAAPASFTMGSPALNLYINTFTFSHNVAPIDDTGAEPLGKGGCQDCHAPGSPLFASNPSYAATYGSNLPNLAAEGNSTSLNNMPVGFKGQVFIQPNDGGLQMVCDDTDGDGTGDCANGAQRVLGAATFPCPTGGNFNPGGKYIFRVNMDDEGARISDGQAVRNIIPQEKTLCFTENRLRELTWQSTVPGQGIPDVDADPDATTHCVDLNRDFICDDLDGNGTPDELAIPSNTTINPRFSATASYYRDSNGDVVPQHDLGIAVDAARSLCKMSGGCTYQWTFSTDAAGTQTVAPTAWYSGSATSVAGVAQMPSAGRYYVSLTIRNAATGHTAWKTIATTAEAKNDAPTGTVTTSVNGMTVTLTVIVDDPTAAIIVSWGDSNLTQNTYKVGDAISFTYTESGDYNIGITMKDNQNLSTFRMVNVSVP